MPNNLVDAFFGWTVSVIARSKYIKKLKRRPSSISMQYENLLEKSVCFKNVLKYNMVMKKHYTVIRKKIDKPNEFIEKIMLFMENIAITFEIFKGRNFQFFPKKGVNISKNSFSYLPWK